MLEMKNVITYFSMNFLCCSPSAQLKKSSTSRAVGTSVADEFCSCILSSVVLDAFVEELGVRMLSGFLIKLQGVDSLLLPRKTNTRKNWILNKNYRPIHICSISTHSIHQMGTRKRAGWTDSSSFELNNEQSNVDVKIFRGIFTWFNRGPGWIG